MSHVVPKSKASQTLTAKNAVSAHTTCVSTSARIYHTQTERRQTHCTCIMCRSTSFGATRWPVSTSLQLRAGCLCHIISFCIYSAPPMLLKPFPLPPSLAPFPPSSTLHSNSVPHSMSVTTMTLIQGSSQAGKTLQTQGWALNPARCVTTTTCVQPAQWEPGYVLGLTPLPQSNAQHVLTQGSIHSAFHTIADVKSTWLH